jgi:hypothetical protein
MPVYTVGKNLTNHVSVQKGLFQMKNSDQEITKQINIKATLILVPLVGIFISFMFMSAQNMIKIDSLVRHLIYGIVVTLGLWSGCMGIVTYLWKKYSWQHHPVKHLLIEIVAILIYTLLLSGGLYRLGLYFNFVQSIGNVVTEAFFTVIITFFITTLHEAVFFYRQWKFNFSKSIQLQNQHLKAKYENLKTHINPHYIFNSLNNLVAIVDDNPLAVEYINQMSAYMRYMLKSRTEELATLEEELNMLEKYIYLHKVRYGEIFTIEINIEDKVKGLKLPPLTLQMLVENCIKHNVISKRKHLHIQIINDDDIILIQNNRNPKKAEDSTGQGLKNIKERYKYFTNKEIIVIETETYFKVSVPLIREDR